MHAVLHQPLGFSRDHRYTVEHASDYVDGELDEAGSVRVEHHAGFCPKCYELLVSLRRTVVALRELRFTDDEPHDDIAARVIARLRAER